MFGKFRKGKKKESDEIKVKGDGGKDEKRVIRKKKEEPKGSSWAAALVLIVTVVLGAVFWIYGRVSGSVSGERETRTVRVGRGGRSGLRMEEGGGVIIFEKE